MPDACEEDLVELVEPKRPARTHSTEDEVGGRLERI
jgi:hypothetical protein